MNRYKKQLLEEIKVNGYEAMKAMESYKKHHSLNDINDAMIYCLEYLNAYRIYKWAFYRR